MRLLLCSLLLTTATHAGNVFVAPTGDDAGPGTIAKPYRTIQHAVDALQPGDTCYLRGGTYRETVTLPRSGTADQPIRISGYPGERVVLDGTDPIPGPWAPYQGKILKTKSPFGFQQLFVNKQMMLEARWPNTTFDKLLTRDGWATTGPKSKYQEIQDPTLAQTGIDWNGAQAMLNVAHQFWSWSRPVLDYQPGGETFGYKISMNPYHYENRNWWDDDFYYLYGKLEALDAPTEWYLADDDTLYLQPPDGVDLNQAEVVAKARDFGLKGDGLSYVQVSGLEFFGCTFELTEANHCLVEHCNLLFPSFTAGVPDADEKPGPAPGTRVIGSDNIVRSCSFQHVSNYGIRVSGQRNLVENSLFYDLNWSGTLRYTAINLTGPPNVSVQNVARGNTCYDVGNTIINVSGPDSVVEYNHVHHGGLISADVSLLYTSTDRAMGIEMRYNWLHDSLSPNNSLGIRGDDKTRGLRAHHNVVWNIRRDGIVVKGGLNRVYNNTCFANNSADIMFFSGREPDKWWQEHIKAYEHQNEDSLLINNDCRVIASVRRRSDPGIPGDYTNNYLGQDSQLRDPDHLDFRPAPGSPLIDAGRAVEGITAPFTGKAPDIGAYESDVEPWLPGHHNGVELSRGVDGVRTRLTMPITAPVRVAVQPGGTLTFTETNWDHAVKLPGNATRVRFSTDAWGATDEVELSAVKDLTAVRVTFAKPDLSSAMPLDRKYDYAESYQAEPAAATTTLQARLAPKAPAIDGRLDAAEWPLLNAQDGLFLTSIAAKTYTAPPAGLASLMIDGGALYVGVRVDRVPGEPTAETTNWGKDDGVEVDLRAVKRVPDGPIFVLHGFPNGHFESSDTAGAPAAAVAQLGRATKYAAQVTDATWTAEWRIPLDALGLPLDQVQHLQLNVGVHRNGGEGGPWYALARTGGANYEVDTGALLRLKPALPAAAPNRLTNGSFETDLQPWTLSSNQKDPIPGMTVERVEEGIDGSWCVKYTATDAEAMKTRIQKLVCPIKDICLAGHTYLLSYDLRTEGLTPQSGMGSFNAYLRVQKPGTAGANDGQQDTLITTKNLPWSHQETVIKVPEEAVSSILSLQLHQATGTVWVDRVSLVEVPE